MTLRTLKEFNEGQVSSYNISNKPRHNAIACPECGKELYDSEPNIILTSYPPKKSIHCDCGYRGYRIC